MPKTQKKGMSNLAKGLVGAAVGVGLAVAGKKMLSNKKVKKQISEKYKGVKEFAKKTGKTYGQDLAKKAKSKVKKIKKVLKEKE